MKKGLAIIVGLLILVIGAYYFLTSTEEVSDSNLESKIETKESTTPVVEEENKPADARPAANSGEVKEETVPATNTNANNAQTAPEVNENTQATTEEAVSYKIASNSKASYVVQKKFFSRPTEEVIGTTNDITGKVVVKENKKVEVKAEIEVTFASGSGSRDGIVKGLLGEKILVSGNDLDLDLSGSSRKNVNLNLTINGVTKSVPFSVRVSSGEAMSADGTANIKMSDFNVQPPKLANVYTVDNEMEVRFNVFLTK